MATYTGTVRRNDLEGGFFELVADDGEIYRLQGTRDVSVGDRVRVHGTVETGGFGIHMSGPSIVVKKVEPLS